MKKSRYGLTSWSAAGFAVLAIVGAACAADSGGGAEGQAGSAAGFGGASAGNGEAAGSGAPGDAGAGGDSAGSRTGSAGASGSGVAGSDASGGSAGVAGPPSDAGAGGSGGTVIGTGAACADPTPKGSLDVPNVGTAPPTTLTQIPLPNASPAVTFFASVPGNLPAASTTDPAKQLGLFIVFHEHSSNAAAEVPSVTKSLVNLKRAGDFVVLGLPISTTVADSAEDHAHAKLLLDYAVKTWPINPRRVYVWGRGAGALLANSWATENKAAIASMVTYSWGLDRRWPSNAANDQPDFYLVIGLDDYPDSHVPLVRRVYNYAKTAGFNIIYREVPGLKGPTGNAPTNDDAVGWAISTRHKTLPLSAAEQALIAPYQDASAAQGMCPDAAKFAQIELVGGAAAGKVMPALLNAGTEASRVLAAQVAGRADFGDAAATALGAKLKDPSSAVRKAAITSLGVQANWRNPGAQKALIDFAIDAAGNAAERALAVDAIGFAVKFQIGGDVATGGYQDPPLFAALITLLSDSNVTLRAKAFAILKPAMTSNYDPTLDPATQQAAITTWKTWQTSLKP